MEKLEYFFKIIKESIIVVMLTSFIGLISGTLLSFNEQILYAFPIIILILPSLNSLIGDMSTVLISRLTTHLYIGSIPPKIKSSTQLLTDFIGLVSTIGLSLIFLIIIGYGIALVTGIEVVNPVLIVTLISITVVLLFVLMFVLLFISSVYLFKRGKDPNNYLIPLVTSSADFLTPLFLIILIQIFLII